MDCPNSEQNVPNESICAKNLTESANEQNQNQNASTSHTIVTMSDDTQVNKSFTFETLKNTIKHLRTASGNEWPKCLIKIWCIAIDILQQNDDESAKAIQLTVKSTLDSMLMSEWNQIDKEPLKNKIIECIPLLQNHPNMLYRCKYIITNMDDPWSNSTFKKIISHNGNADEIIGTDQQNEEIEFFAVERGCLIEMRAQKLIEIGDCDDIAIKFLSHAIQAIHACANDHLLRQTVSCRQLQSLLECYLSLLSKTRQMDKLKKELESMQLETIKEFIVNSFLSISEYDRINQMKNSAIVDKEKKSEKKKKKHKKGKRTWIEILLEHHISVSKFAVQFILVRILNDEYIGDGNIDTILEKLLGIWIEQNRGESDFEELFTKLVNNAIDNRKKYECCESFHRLFPDDCGAALQVFCKTLTLEINQLEEKKFDLSAEASTLLNFEQQISERYLFLHNILYSYAEKRECALTAFSMNPTQSNFELVCKYSEETGSNDQKAMPFISDSLKSDLGCLLSQPRIKKLCWSNPWPELKNECQKLMQTENKIKILENSTATANDNLKYLHLNYDDFVNFKPHKYPGIEDGYDIYIIDSDSDSKSNAFDIDSDGTDTAPESKDYILEEKKEAQRMRTRKRNLIRRSQKQLADPGCSDRNRSRKHTINDSIDGLKIKRFPRKNVNKKTIKSDPDANQTLDSSIDITTILPKEEQQIEDEQNSTNNNWSESVLTEIKIEPATAKMKMDENVMPFDETIPEIKVKDIETMKLEDVDIELESDIKTEIDLEYDEASIQTIIFGNQINETMEITPTKNQTINEENVATENNDPNTSLSIQTMQDSQIHLDPELDSINVNTNNPPEMPDEQIPKRKNPLLSVRRPKKQPKLESIQYDSETIRHSSDLISLSAPADCISHHSDCSTNGNESEMPCEMEMDNFHNHRTENCFQDTTNVLGSDDNIDEKTNSQIVILTKHCTVRLQRLPDQMLEDLSHHSSESDENSENIESTNDTEYCKNDTKTIGENTENNGLQDSLTKSNDVDVEVNSNIMYDGEYQSNNDFTDSLLNSLSNQSSTVLNGYENECNGQEKLQEIHETMAKVDEQSKQCDEIDQFQSLSMNDTQQQCMKHVQFQCMSIRINYSNHLSNMYPLSTYLEQCQTFTKKAYGLEALHQNRNEKNCVTPSTSLIRLCINNYCEWFLLKLPLPVTHIIIIYAKNAQGKFLLWKRSNDYSNEHRLLSESHRFISNIHILELRKKNIKICVTILFGIAIRIWYSKFSFVKPSAKKRQHQFSDIFLFVFILDFISNFFLLCGLFLIVDLTMKTFKNSIKNDIFDAKPKLHCIKNRLKCWNKEYSTQPKFQYTDSDVRKMDDSLSFAHRWKSSKLQWPIKSIVVVRMVQVLFTNDKHVQIRADNDNPDQSNSRTTSQQTGVSIIGTTRNNFERSGNIVAKPDPIIEMTGNASGANETIQQNGNNETLTLSHQIIQNKPITKSSASQSNHLFYMLNSPPKPIPSKFPHQMNTKIINNETVSHAQFLLKNNGTDSSVVLLKNGIGNAMNGTVIRRIMEEKSTASAAIEQNISKPLEKSGNSSANNLINFQSIGLNASTSSMNESTYTINQINRNDNKLKTELKTELNTNQHILLNGVCTRTIQSDNLTKFGFRIQMKNQSHDRGTSIPPSHTISKVQMDKTKYSPKIIREKQNIRLKNNANGNSGNFAVTSSQGIKNRMIIIEEKSKDVSSRATAPSTITQTGQSSIKSIRNDASAKLPVITVTSRELPLPDNRKTFAINHINDNSQVQLNTVNKSNILNSATALQSVPVRLKKNSFILTRNGKPQQKDLANQLREFDMVMEQIKEQGSITLANKSENVSIILAKNENPSNLSKIDIKNCHQNTTTLTPAINLTILNKNFTAEEGSETSESQDTISDKTEHESTELEDILSDSNGENQKDRQSRLFSPKQIQKLQEDEKTTKRIYDILAKYAEQMSSSPDLKNKPAPRRRSNLIHLQSFAATGTTLSPNTDIIPKVTIPNAGHNESNQINVDPILNLDNFCDDTGPSAHMPKKRKKSPPNSSTNKIAKCDVNDVRFIPLQQTSRYSTVITPVNENLKTIKLPFGQQDCPTVKESLSNTQKTSPNKIGDRQLVIGNSTPCTTAILLSGNYFLPMGMVKYASECTDIAKNQCRQKLFQLKKNPDKSVVNDAKNYKRSTVFSPDTYVKKGTNDSQNGLSTNDGTKIETSNGPTKGTTLKLVSIKNPPNMSAILMNTLVQSNIHSKNSKAQLHGNAHLQSGILRPNSGVLLLDNSYAALISGNSTVLEAKVPKQTNGNNWTTLKSTSNSVPSVDGPKHGENSTKNYLTIKSSDHSKINVLHITDTDKCTKISSVQNSPSASKNEYPNQSLDTKQCTNSIKHMFRDDAPLNLPTDDCDILNDIELSMMESSSRQHSSIDENWLKIKSVYEDYQEHLDQPEIKLILESTREKILVDADNLSASFESDTKDPGAKMKPSLIDVQKSDQFTLNSMLMNPNKNSSSKLIFRRESVFQKSLSEECGDLGVDEPCTSELFPEAFII